jgi:hypothetical protein
MTNTLFIAITLLALYGVFLVWYGGKGKPLSATELAQCRRELHSQTEDPSAIDEVMQLLASDDGREFVMQNLARYRPKALYPTDYAPAVHFGDSARAADQRYAKALLWPLLRQGSVPIFIARRIGSFIEPEGADAWHYVAMVRYRSRRDFFKFAMAIQRDDIVVHKWAALEKTHVFPVAPLVSLVFVRGAVAVLLALVGLAIYGVTA